MASELVGYGTEDSSQTQKPAWSIGLDLSSITSGLLGGQTANSFHVGAQVKRRVAKNTIRFNSQYYPRTSFHFGFNPVDREVGIQAGHTIYMASEVQSELGRIGCGFDRGKESGVFRTYFGGDIWAHYENTSVSAWTYVEDNDSETHERLEGSQNGNRIRTSSFGPGLSPLMGIESDVDRKFGVSLEAKFDIALIAEQGYTIDDSADFIKTGYWYNFRTFPLLEFRLFYRL
ncbi:MAG: hypothetical protein R2813_07565 [Flavobacteriales bacterium]